MVSALEFPTYHSRWANCCPVSSLYPQVRYQNSFRRIRNNTYTVSVWLFLCDMLSMSELEFASLSPLPRLSKIIFGRFVMNQKKERKILQKINKMSPAKKFVTISQFTNHRLHIFTDLLSGVFSENKMALWSMFFEENLDFLLNYNNKNTYLGHFRSNHQLKSIFLFGICICVAISFHFSHLFNFVGNLDFFKKWLHWPQVQWLWEEAQSTAVSSNPVVR